MILFCRFDEPDFLQRNAVAWTRDYIGNKARNPRHKFRWRGGSELVILSTLKQSNASHCAFCDGRIGAQTQEIEHFKPAGTTEYFNYVYSWDNLFPICSNCNKAKGGRFDELLLKPDESGFSFYSFFIFNINSGEIKPNPAASAHNQNRATKTIDLYKLNRVELRRDRKEQYVQASDLITPEGKYTLDDFPYRFQLATTI